MTTADAPNTPYDLLTDPEFVSLANVQFIRGVSVATIVIAIALYVGLFAVSGIVAGLFGAAYAIARFAFVLPLGRLVDRGDAKRYLLAGFVVHGIVLVGFVGAGAIEHVVLLRALQGVGSVCLYLSATAIVGELSPENDRGLWMGTYNQVSPLSKLVGDIVGGLLLFTQGFGVTYAVLFVLTVVAALVVVVFLRGDPGESAVAEEATGVEVIRRLLVRRPILALMAFRFTFSLGKTAVVLFLPIYARTEFGMNALTIGGILAGGRLTKSVAQGYVGTISDRVGRESWFIVAGTLLYAAGTALIPYASAAEGGIGTVSVSPPVVGQTAQVSGVALALFGTYVVIGLADSLRLPTGITLFVNEGERHDAVAGSLSLRSIAWQSGAIAGPLVAGWILDSLSFIALFWLAAGVVAASALVFAVLYDPDLAAGDR